MKSATFGENCEIFNEKKTPYTVASVISVWPVIAANKLSGEGAI